MEGVTEALVARLISILISAETVPVSSNCQTLSDNFANPKIEVELELWVPLLP